MDIETHSIECPHCYAITHIEWEHPIPRPKYVYCPSCGEQENPTPLDFDNEDYDEPEEWSDDYL